MQKILLLAISTLLLACNSHQTSDSRSNSEYADSVKTGGNKLILIDGKYHVWTKKVGSGKIKVLLLHGGPGFPHDYMECYEDFLPKDGMEIYYYDQLGCGNSDMPTDTTLWNIRRYVQEVEQVRKALGLEQFYLVGHSWGGMLAMEYLRQYQDHVKGAVLSNMTGGMKDFTTYADVLKKKLFTSKDLATYDLLDKAKAYDSQQYNDLLMNKLYTQVLCRLPLEKWPEPLLRAFKKVNHTVYTQMQGVDEFHVTGNFKNWEFWSHFPEIKIPTLVLGGIKDEMNPEGLKREGQLIPKSKIYLCPEGSHMAMYDDQQNYFGALTAFLRQVDNGTFKPDPK